MIYKKLLVNEFFKEYGVLKVSEKCFKNSPEIEQGGLMVGFKINSPDDLKFKIQELKKLNFKDLKKW